MLIIHTKENGMAKKDEISATVIKRLPRYYRFLGELIKQGTVRASSAELAKEMSLTASQIRQDLNCFGGFGQQGYGYNLAELRTQIGKILGLDRRKEVILIGAGNLGRALAIHINFEKYGMELCGIFDTDENKIGMTVGGIKISSMDSVADFTAVMRPEIAVLCIPKSAAAECADLLVECGIKAFWNFSHLDLTERYKDIVVENVHLGDSLMLLSYGLTNL